MTATAAARVGCKRCGRTLTAAGSRAAGIGRTCALREARETVLRDAGLTAGQQAEALQLLADKAVIPSAREGVFLVISRDGETAYRTTTDHCNCPWGLRAMTTASVKPCKHIGAVRARLARPVPAARARLAIAA